tara:strand:- start:258 stop:431 length:174 start_codon:yes stop_codon:yes gene_type:complete
MGNIKTKMSEHDTLTIKGYNSPQEPPRSALNTFLNSLTMIYIELRLLVSKESAGMNQ